MSTTKRLVCLANSRKLSGLCIAGKEIRGSGYGNWVRPVSARNTEEVSEEERQYEDGSDPTVPDIVDIPLLRSNPKDYQQENWLLDPDYYWTKAGRKNWDELAQVLDPIEPLWVDGSSTYNGRNDRIPLAQATTLASSLRFIHVDDLIISVFRPGEDFGNLKRRVQGRFVHGGTRLPILPIESPAWTSPVFPKLARCAM